MGLTIKQMLEVRKTKGGPNSAAGSNMPNFADVLCERTQRESEEEAAVSSSMFRWKRRFNLVSIDGVAPPPRLSGSGHPTIGPKLD